MSGTVRENVAGLRTRLDERRRSDPALPGLAGELFATADVIGRDPQLRGALADAGQPSQARVGTVQALFGGRVSAAAEDALCDVVGQRWPSAWSMVEALEGLGAQAAFLSAQMAGSLHAVADQIFSFAQAVGSSPQLQMALTDPAVGVDQKGALVRTLMDDRAEPQAVEALAYAMSHLRGRRADSVLDDLMEQAAEQQDRAVAEVRVARPLEPDQAERLAAVLSRLQGRAVRLNVAVDPAIIGGISVRVGEQVMDATTAQRIEQARRTLVG